jgi:hypothetical protein
MGNNIWLFFPDVVVPLLGWACLGGMVVFYAAFLIAEFIKLVKWISNHW